MITILAFYPFLIGLLYLKIIKSSHPLPNLDQNMQLDEIQSIYGTIDIKVIEKKSYTIQKHEHIM